MSKENEISNNQHVSDEVPEIEHELSQANPSNSIISQTANDQSCSCGGTMESSKAHMPPPYVYAMGKILARFPNLSLEKEYYQVVGRTPIDQTTGKIDSQVLQATLKDNPYLARQMCWILSVQGVETYILHPRDIRDYDVLINALRPVEDLTDLDLVIGIKGSIAPPEACNGLMIPIVGVDQIYSFTIDSLLGDLPKPPKGTSDEQFRNSSQNLLLTILRMTDNAGATDEHRSLNYLAVRYSAIYTNTLEMQNRNFSPDGVRVRRSPIAGTRKIYDVIFIFRHRVSNVIERYFVRVDDTGEWPFLVTPWQSLFESY